MTTTIAMIQTMAMIIVITIAMNKVILYWASPMFLHN